MLYPAVVQPNIYVHSDLAADAAALVKQERSASTGIVLGLGLAILELTGASPSIVEVLGLGQSPVLGCWAVCL